MRMLWMVLFLALLSVALATPRTGQCKGGGCPIGESCLNDIGCDFKVCNLRCVGVQKFVGPKYCVLAVPLEDD